MRKTRYPRAILVDFGFIFSFIISMIKQNYYSQAVVHLGHLKHNLKVIRSLVKKRTKVLVPVKCNAYGFGMAAMSRFLEKQGVDYLGTAFPFEALDLRRQGIRTPILVFDEIIHPEDYKQLVSRKVTATLFTEDSLSKLAHAAKGLGKRARVHVKIDTGMGRNGISHEEALPFIQKVLQTPGLELEGVYTHLSSADEKEKAFTQEQFLKFRHIIRELKNRNIAPPLIHALNSAGIMNYPEYAYSMVRPGLMFYGYFPDNRIKKEVPLKQGLSLRARVCNIKTTRDHTPVSYGHTYYTRGNEVIATIGIGYGDGMDRLLSNSHSILYKDILCPVRGRVCMDQFMADITRVSSSRKGDWVTVFGMDEKKEIRLEEIAERIRTVAYELICGINSRVERTYVP
jgi:alanine racemase